MSARRALLERLGSEDRAIQRGASEEVLAQLASDTQLRRGVLRLLREGTALARFSAAWVLFHEGPGLRILPSLLESLELDDGDLRWQAAHMLTLLGRTQSEVLPVLLHESRESPSARRRRMALYAVRELGPERAETEQVLLHALTDPDAEVRRAGLSSLAKLSDPSRTCLDRVQATLQDDGDPRMRRIAAVVLPALVRRHPEAAAGVERALAQAETARDPSLARAAQRARLRLQAGA